MLKEKHTNTTIIPADSNRRKFMQLALKALGAVAVVEIGAIGSLFLTSHSLDGEFGGIITVGQVEDFTPGSVVSFEEGNFYLVRTLEGGFLAIYRRCPHLGCTVNWVPQKEKFFCPCHAASFDPNGEGQSQVVARSLDTFPILFEDGAVKVDTSRIQVREHHSPEHISYAR